MKEQIVLKERGHFPQLDSLRGVAALAVVLHHWHIFWLLSPHPNYLVPILQVLPFRLMIAGHSAVMIFFVLSGFVLSLPQIANKPINYPAYLIKRVCRIYLPYLVALGVAVLGCWKWHGMHAYGTWFEGTWTAPPNWRTISQHLLFLGVYDTSRYNIVFWTLVQEMRISIVFPFLCAFVLRFGPRQGMLIALTLLLADPVLIATGWLNPTFCETIGFAGMFVLGILLAKYRKSLQGRLARLSRISYWTLFLGCIVLYAYTPTVLNYFNLSGAAWDGTTAIGAAGIILYSLADYRIDRFLVQRPILFLGKISYSLYLLHTPILFAFGYVMYRRASPTVWLIPYVAITILCAAGMYRFIELGSIRLGRALASRVASRTSTSTAAQA